MILLAGGPCDGERREMDSRHQLIDVMPRVDLATVTSDTPVPQAARYERTYRRGPAGEEIYRYAPERDPLNRG
jgi:hypothetical protein